MEPGLMLVMFVTSIAATVWWVLILLECIQNEPAEGNDRVIWVLVIVLAGFLGAVIYVVGRRSARVRLYGR